MAIDLVKRCNEDVTLVKKDGNKLPFKALVQPYMIITVTVELPFETGDTVERKLPSGLTEVYDVLQSDYFAAHKSIASHYELQVKGA